MYIADFVLYKDLFLAYLKDIKKVSHNTYKSYALDIDQFILFWRQDTIRPLNVMLTHFIESHYQQDHKVSSIARKISCFNSFKNFLKTKNITIVVPVKRPVVKLASPRVIDSKTLCVMLDSISNDQLNTKRPYRERAIIELLYATGMSVSELISLEIGHINFGTQQIVIRGKKKSERIVHFGDKAHDIILQYIAHERSQIKSSQERLFLNHINQPLTSRSIQRICKLFSDHLPQYVLTPSILRNSCAQHLLMQGADEATVQKLLGHKVSISTARYKRITGS